MLKLGIIVNKRNIDGTLIVLPIIENVKDIKRNSIVKVGYSENFSTEYKIIDIISTRNKYLIKLRSIDTPEKADELKEQAIFIDKKDLIFDEISSRFNYQDFKVINLNDGALIGYVKDYFELPANDVLLVKNHNKEYLIPFIKDVIYEINENKKYIKIIPIEGLLNDGENED